MLLGTFNWLPHEEEWEGKRERNGEWRCSYILIAAYFSSLCGMCSAYKLSHLVPLQWGRIAIGLFSCISVTLNWIYLCLSVFSPFHLFLLCIQDSIFIKAQWMALLWIYCCVNRNKVESIAARRQRKARANGDKPHQTRLKSHHCHVPLPQRRAQHPHHVLFCCIEQQCMLAPLQPCRKEGWGSSGALCTMPCTAPSPPK